MPKKIIQLDERTINQIAAGEVVENPASVVKELVENSIDAGSKKIQIEILDGGFSLIQITDNGEGFSKEDLDICLHRHTTSKLQTVEDLWKIRSMGFRGEALASISAISEFSILTKSKDAAPNDPGYLLKNTPMVSIAISPREVGSTISVKSLFYNVPARKAFQKSASQSLTDIIKVVTKIALGFPHVEIQLKSGGKEIFSHLAKNQEDVLGKLKEAIEETLDAGFLKDSFKISEEFEDFKIFGYLGGFNQTRSNRLGQYLFINQRAVTSPLISQVVKNAYGTRINSIAYPTFVLHIEIPSMDVDVNVHPQKKEVRIKDEKEISEKIRKAVIKSLLQIAEEKIFTPMKMDTFSFSPRQNVSSFQSSYKPSFSAKPHIFEPEKIDLPKVEIEKPTFLPTREIPILGKLYHYLIVQSEELAFLDLYLEHPISLINIQALKSRLHYEKLKASLLSDAQNLHFQTLLFPVTLEYSTQEAMKLEQNIDLIAKFGIEMQQIGPKSFSVHSLIEGIEENEVGEWIEMILHDIERIDEETVQLILLKKLAKKMKISYEKFSEKALHQALQELLKLEEKNYSPSGDKIVIGISPSHLEKL